jgi:hypothetical protein
MKNNILQLAGLHALATATYVSLVASFLFYAPKLIVGKTAEDTVFMPIAMLMLLVVSAAITGSLVFGRSILWYLDGKKKDAVSLLLSTLGALFIITVVAFIVMIQLVK